MLSIKQRNLVNRLDEGVSDHFVDVNKSINSGKWATFEIDDFMLSRYACYLIAQNWDPKKQEIAFTQAYFALQTRKQELLEEYMGEHQRLMSRKKLKLTESEFQTLAFQRWVDGSGIARIRNKADTILFGWYTTGSDEAKTWSWLWSTSRPLARSNYKSKGSCHWNNKS